MAEYIRQNSLRFCRDEDMTARHSLETTLNNLPPHEALQIIRALGFSLKSPTSPRIGSRSAISVPNTWMAIVRHHRRKARLRTPSPGFVRPVRLGDEANVNRLGGQSAKNRIGVGRKRARPLGRVLGVFPARLVRGDVSFSRVLRVIAEAAAIIAAWRST
jgi:hypothetical protein